MLLKVDFVEEKFNSFSIHLQKIFTALVSREKHNTKH
jgi:hypothetical protein